MSVARRLALEGFYPGLVTPRSIAFEGENAVAGGGGGVLYERTVSDTLSILDSILRALQSHRLTGDSVLVSDVLARALDLSRRVPDNIALADSISFVASYARASADTIATSDVVTWNAVYERKPSDTIAVLDLARRELSMHRVMAEAVVIPDVMQWGWVLWARVPDVVTPTDFLSYDLWYSGSITFTDRGRFAFALTDDVRTTLDLTNGPRCVIELSAAKQNFTSSVVPPDGLANLFHFTPESGPMFVVAFEHEARVVITFEARALSQLASTFTDGPACTMSLEDDLATEIIMSHERFYDVGDVAEVTGTIRRRSTGELLDPSTLEVWIQPPASWGPLYSVVYVATDPRVVRDSQAVYRTVLDQLDKNAVGDWTIQYNAGGQAAAMQSTIITVRAPRIALALFLRSHAEVIAMTDSITAVLS